MGTTESSTPNCMHLPLCRRVSRGHLRHRTAAYNSRDRTQHRSLSFQFHHHEPHYQLKTRVNSSIAQYDVQSRLQRKDYGDRSCPSSSVLDQGQEWFVVVPGKLACFGCLVQKTLTISTSRHYGRQSSLHRLYHSVSRGIAEPRESHFGLSHSVQTGRSGSRYQEGVSLNQNPQSGS